MPKRRHLLVLTEFPPRIGGMQTHAVYLAKHLHDRGDEVKVVTYQATREEQRQSAARIDADLPYPVVRRLSRLAHFENVDRLTAIADAFAPDLVYTSTVFYGALRERLGVPVVSRSVGNDVLRPWIVYPYRPFQELASAPWFEDRLYATFRRLDYPEPLEALWREKRRDLMIDSARSLDRVLANSAFTQNLLEGIGVAPERVQVVTGGVDYSRFEGAKAQTDLRAELGIPQDRHVLMTVCRLVRKKGLGFLVDSMPAILEAMPDAHLVIVGHGRHARRLRRQARASNAAERITFTGAIPHDQVPAFYTIANTFVLASREQLDPLTGLRDCETMGRVLCEANAAGVPVVAARSGGIPSVITHRDNGLLFEPDNERDLVDTLLLRRDDASLVERMVDTGRRTARDRFDWSVIMDTHERCFDKLLGPTTADAPPPPVSVRSAAMAATV